MCPEECPLCPQCDKVCGTDGVEYPSVCDLVKEKCVTGKDIGIAEIGAC